MKFNLSEKNIFKWLLVLIIVFVIFGISGQISGYFFGHWRLFGFGELFNLNGESNIPTFFSTSLLILSACLILVIYKSKKAIDKDRKYWLGMIVIFIYLGIDEAAQIHEKFSYFFEDYRLPGMFYFSWVIIGILMSLIIVIFYIRFVWLFLKGIRRLFVLSAIIYIAGALVVEMISAWYFKEHSNTFLFNMISTIEELLEMLGAALFIKVFLRYIRFNLGNLNLKFEFKQ